MGIFFTMEAAIFSTSDIKSQKKYQYRCQLKRTFSRKHDLVLNTVVSVSVSDPDFFLLWIRIVILNCKISGFGLRLMCFQFVTHSVSHEYSFKVLAYTPGIKLFTEKNTTEYLSCFFKIYYIFTVFTFHVKLRIFIIFVSKCKCKTFRFLSVRFSVCLLFLTYFSVCLICQLPRSYGQFVLVFIAKSE